MDSCRIQRPLKVFLLSGRLSWSAGAAFSWRICSIVKRLGRCGPLKSAPALMPSFCSCHEFRSVCSGPQAESRVLILCGKDRSQATSDGTNHEKYEQDNTRHKRSDSRVLMLYGEDSTNNISAISPRENAIISAISPREDAIISAISHDPHDVSDEGATLLGGLMEPAMKTLAVLHF